MRREPNRCPRLRLDGRPNIRRRGFYRRLLRAARANLRGQVTCAGGGASQRCCRMFEASTDDADPRKAGRSSWPIPSREMESWPQSRRGRDDDDQFLWNYDAGICVLWRRRCPPIRFRFANGSTQAYDRAIARTAAVDRCSRSWQRPAEMRRDRHCVRPRIRRSTRAEAHPLMTYTRPMPLWESHRLVESDRSPISRFCSEGTS